MQEDPLARPITSHSTRDVNRRLRRANATPEMRATEAAEKKKYSATIPHAAGRAFRRYGIPRDVALSYLTDHWEDDCHICGKPQAERRHHLDHDHTSGAIRGMLCLSCNVSVGHFRDDPEMLRRAARYLEGVLL